jgi:HSP20 family protein
MSQVKDTQKNKACATGTCATTTTPEITPQRVRPEWKMQDDGETATLQVALPGVIREQVTISSKERVVTLEAARELPEGTIQPLHYALNLRLSPDLDPKATQARLQNGVLKVQFARKEEARPRAIPVSDE